MFLLKYWKIWVPILIAIISAVFFFTRKKDPPPPVQPVIEEKEKIVHVDTFTSKRKHRTRIRVTIPSETVIGDSTLDIEIDIDDTSDRKNIGSITWERKVSPSDDTPLPFTPSRTPRDKSASEGRFSAFLGTAYDGDALLTGMIGFRVWKGLYLTGSVFTYLPPKKRFPVGVGAGYRIWKGFTIHAGYNGRPYAGIAWRFR